jgi:hypothetical protein
VRHENRKRSNQADQIKVIVPTGKLIGKNRPLSLVVCVGGGWGGIHKLRQPRIRKFLFEHYSLRFSASRGNVPRKLRRFSFAPGIRALPPSARPEERGRFRPVRAIATRRESISPFALRLIELHLGDCGHIDRLGHQPARSHCFGHLRLANAFRNTPLNPRPLGLLSAAADAVHGAACRWALETMLPRRE